MTTVLDASTAPGARPGAAARVAGRIKGLACRECGQQFPIEPIHVCDFCFGPLEVQYDYDLLRAAVTRESIERGPIGIWRYRDLLPVESLEDTGWRVGYTPLQPAHNLGKALGVDDLWIKNDSVNPTFSFKDRVVAVASAKAREFGFDTFACASTGNLASAVAAAGIRVGLKTYVFLPWDTEQSKILNALVYGANVVAVKGTYDDVNRLCSEIADQKSWAFCNINVRPYYSEGSKTLAFETAEQLGWEAPDHVVVPIASGSLLTKIVRERGGAVLDATDEEIADGMRLLASTEGVFAETAGGVTIAVLKKLVEQGVVKRGERTVAYITGNGLKTLDAVAPMLAAPPLVDPTIDAFEAYLREQGR